MVLQTACKRVVTIPLGFCQNRELLRGGFFCTDRIIFWCQIWEKLTKMTLNPHGTANGVQTRCHHTMGVLPESGTFKPEPKILTANALSKPFPNRNLLFRVKKATANDSKKVDTKKL